MSSYGPPMLTPSSGSIYASPDSAYQQGLGQHAPRPAHLDLDAVAAAASSQLHQHLGQVRHQHSNGGGRGDPDAEGETDDPASPSKKKQKRNKPTLSCYECVERKTKCDRGRPHCLACIKRQTDCKYAIVADLLEATTTRAVGNGRRMTKPPKRKDSTTPTDGSSPRRHTIPNIADRGVEGGRALRGSVALSTGLLSNVPYSHPTASNVFGIGSEHPFANYWTCEGGLPEVVQVLPSKLQADVLLDRYFECVDPVYPMIHRTRFYTDYELFWSLPTDDKNRGDASFVALVFVMLALGTQFVASTNPDERKQTAEFYASASNQALRMSSYLSSASICSVQAMVLMTYFLINDNHASDGWAFAGILMRQAYAMGLHRDPNIVTPNASPFEKQQRRKLWQAVLLQDTFLTVLLSLPPSATHSDVSVEDLMTGDDEDEDNEADYYDYEDDEPLSAASSSNNMGLPGGGASSTIRAPDSPSYPPQSSTSSSSMSSLRSVLDNYSFNSVGGPSPQQLSHLNNHHQQHHHAHNHQQQLAHQHAHQHQHIPPPMASPYGPATPQYPSHHGAFAPPPFPDVKAEFGSTATSTSAAPRIPPPYPATARATDTAYIRGSWTLANLVQEAICSPRSLDLPICTTARHKTKLVGDFRAVYRSFPDGFRSWDPDSLAAIVRGVNTNAPHGVATNGRHGSSRAAAAAAAAAAATPSAADPSSPGSSSGGPAWSNVGSRAVRQTLFLTSNYFHNLMLVHASEHLPDVPVNVRGTLEAAHDAITSFFVLFGLFEAEARVWWVFNHRAFLEALCIGAVLREVGKDAAGKMALARDPLFVRARADLNKMIQIMQIMGDGEQGSDVARTRVRVLQELV